MRHHDNVSAGFSLGENARRSGVVWPFPNGGLFYAANHDAASGAESLGATKP